MKTRQLQGGKAPLTRGFAPGPHCGQSPQTPIIGSRSTLAMWPPFLNSWIRQWWYDQAQSHRSMSLNDQLNQIY